tara:strand:- start:1939 stop:2727 length:789 start_codon:yes stop_codon:yes gene_type:complete
MSDEPISRGTIQNPPASIAVTLAANETRPVYYAYNYIRVTEGSYSRGDVEFRFSDTGQPSTLVNGQGVKLEEVVGRVTLTNTTGSAITLTLDLGIGEIYDDRLSVSGTLKSEIWDGSDGPVDVVVGSTNSLRVYDANTLDVERLLDGTSDGIQQGQKTLGSSALNLWALNGTVGTLVTPAANVNGVLVVNAKCGGSSYVTLMAKTSAPSGYNDSSAKVLVGSVVSTPSTMPHPILVEAGEGIYYDSSSSQATNHIVGSYTIL